MPTHDALFETLTQSLRRHGLAVSVVHHTLNVSRGEGLQEKKANVDPGAFFEELLVLEPSEALRLVLGYARGIFHAFLEPVRSRGSALDFYASAGKLAMALEVRSFARGIEAVTGELAWTRPFVDDLVWVCHIELDQGLRVLTQPQFERWEVSADRVWAGARSMLYHRSRALRPVPLASVEGFAGIEGIEGVCVADNGDGAGAARCAVLGDLFFSDISAGFRFALPTPELMVFVQEHSPQALASLAQATQMAVERGSYALSSALFGFDFGKPVVVAPHGWEKA